MTATAAPEAAHAIPVVVQPIATLRGYPDLQRAIADYCECIGMSRMELDGAAGLTDGHAAKLLSRIARKRMGWKTLGRVLRAAGLMLILAKDPDAVPRDLDASTLASRSRRYDRAKHFRNVKGPAWGRRMAALRALKLPAARRSEIARIAAQARHQRRQTTSAAPINSSASPEQPA